MAKAKQQVDIYGDTRKNKSLFFLWEEICKITGNIMIGKMYELKKFYNRIDKQKQLRLQELLNTFNFTTENIYNIADNKTKKRINTYIEQWKEQGLLKNNNYFTVLANNIYKRTRVKNSEILELLIYSAYIEEQSKLEEQEKQIMYEDANYYYEERTKRSK